MNYVPTRKPQTFLQREAANKRKREEQLDAWQDPKAMAIRRVRAEMLALSELAVTAGRSYDAENAAIPLPRAISGGLVHPTKARALEQFVADWPDDPRAPITPMRSEAEIMDALASETRAALKQAEADLAEIEAERRRETFADMGLPDPDETAEAPPSGPAEQVAEALDHTALVNVPVFETDEDAPVIPVRRGPGRPSRLDRAIGNARVE